ncbi:GNAT family N-acetyltransferase [Kibdelosporangium lantanae]|uniref:GNAT family N-acetyltransferase n=1 Tax=Kibdelosporangium lantanae TaxID=1497396 RepID=A0ABW3MGR2_9PSEU
MIRQATGDDLKDVGVILGAAFQNDPVSTFLFPDPLRRAAVQPAFFQAFSALALESDGAIYLTEDGMATTVWFASTEADEAEDDDTFMARFDMLADDETERFATLAGWMAENHPTRGDHRHLQFIGVHPDLQRAGVGGTLLRHNLAIVDEMGMPAYLEASSALSPPLYQRHGFEHIGTPFGADPGPKMYPMWREPRR